MKYVISEDSIACDMNGKAVKINNNTFKEWFESKLKVGGFPSNYKVFDFNDYDYIINVSDEYIPYRPDNVWWFPMNECKRDIGLNSIYGACCILNIAFKKNLSVYLHCAAGVNRSQTVKSAFHFMKTGKHVVDDFDEYLNKMFSTAELFDNQLIRNCYYGYLPPLIEMEAFLKRLNNDLEDKTFHPSLDSIKLKTLS